MANRKVTFYWTFLPLYGLYAYRSPAGWLLTVHYLVVCVRRDQGLFTTSLSQSNLNNTWAFMFLWVFFTVQYLATGVPFIIWEVKQIGIEAEETLLCFGKSNMCTLFSGKKFVRLSLTIIKVVQAFKMWKQIACGKLSLRLWKNKQLLCLTMRACGCQKEAVADQPDRRPKTEEYTRKLILMSAVKRNIREAKGRVV